MVRTLILAGYFAMMSYLQVTGKLNQYINPEYQYLTTMTMVISLVLALIQLVDWVKEEPNHEHQTCGGENHHHGGGSRLSRGIMYGLVSLPILAVGLLPTVNLDASIVSAKGFNFPISKDSTSFGDIEQQYLKPNTHIFFNDEDYEELMSKDMEKYQDKNADLVMTDENYLELMELIYNYPQEFIGRKLTIKGFSYYEPQSKHHFLFRFGILHCVADSGVYGLLLNDEENQLAGISDNQWLEVNGTIDTEFYEPFSQTVPRLSINNVSKITPPTNEYVYRIF